MLAKRFSAHNKWHGAFVIEVYRRIVEQRIYLMFIELYSLLFALFGEQKFGVEGGSNRHSAQVQIERFQKCHICQLLRLSALRFG